MEGGLADQWSPAATPAAGGHHKGGEKVREKKGKEKRKE